MTKYQYKIHVESGDAQLDYDLADGPIILGSAPACHLFLMGDGPEIKAIIQREAEFVIIKIFDKNFSIIINEKSYGSAKLKKNSQFKLANFEFKLVISEKSELIEKTASHHLPDYVDEEDQVDLPKSLPNIPKQEVKELALPETVETAPTQVQNEPINHTLAVKNSPAYNNSKAMEAENSLIELEDYFNFKTIFPEVSACIESSHSYMDSSLSFESYISPEDESLVKIPTPEIHKKNKSYSIHITYMNNGTALNDEYYNVKQKRIFLSNKIDRKNYFTVYDAPSTKDEFVFTRNDEIMVLTPVGYSAHKYIDGEFIQLDDNTNRLLKGEKIVLTKNESQITLSIANSPEKIKKSGILDIEDRLIKCVAGSWVFALFFIFTVLVFDKEVQEVKKKEMVVILKRQEIKKFEKEPTPPSQSVAKSEVNQETPKQANLEPEKKVEKAVPKVEQKPTVVEKKIEKPQKKPAEKPVNKPVQQPKKVAKNITVKTKKLAATPVKALKAQKSPAKVPEAKKKFAFGFKSKFKSLVAKASDADLQKSDSKSLNIESAVNSSASTGSSFNKSKIGKTTSKISRFAAGKISGQVGAVGTQGLSGKTDTTTAYLETTTKILGALDPELIRKIMREYIPQFRHCYQRELVTNPAVAGVFDLEFQINARGKGVNVSVAKKGKNFTKGGIKCLTAVVNLIKFPKPKGGGLVDVKQPMNFFQQK